MMAACGANSVGIRPGISPPRDALFSSTTVGSEFRPFQIKLGYQLLKEAP